MFLHVGRQETFDTSARNFGWLHGCPSVMNVGSRVNRVSVTAVAVEYHWLARHRDVGGAAINILIFVQEHIEHGLVGPGKQHLYGQPIFISKVLGFVDDYRIVDRAKRIDRDCQCHWHVMIELVAARQVSTRLSEKVSSLLRFHTVNPSMAHLVKGRDIQIFDPGALLSKVISKAAIVAKEKGSHPFRRQADCFLAGNEGFPGSGTTGDHYPALPP